MVVRLCFSKCSQSTLYPDGTLRCDLDFHLATELCGQIVPGHAKLFDSNAERKEQTKVLQQRVPGATGVKPRTTKPKAIKIKKSKPTQGILF